MRSQILPPALCLMMAILFCFSPTLSTAKNLNFETKIADNNLVMSILETTPSDNLITENVPNKTKEISTTEDLSTSDSKTAIAKEQSLSEVISYDSAAIVATGNSDYQNIGDSSLFRKGMFYGFAIMVINLQ